MSIIKRRMAIAVAGTVLASGFSVPAIAGTGCNGVVNWLVWGCAGWDNNNGSKFPYYRKRAVSVAIPRGGAQVSIKDGAAMITINGQQYPVVGGASSIVAAGGGNLVAQGGGNLVAQGGGNIQVYSGN